MFRYLPLILKNSLRNRRRSLLTIVSVGASLCLLGVLFAMYRAFFLAEPTPAQALRLVTRHRVSLGQPLPVAYESQIRQVPGVREAMVWQWFGGTYKDNRDPKNIFARLGVEPQRLFTIRPELALPEDQKQAFQRLQTGCIAGKEIALKQNWKLGDHITLVGDIFPVTLELTLVGIYDAPRENENLYFNRAYLRESLSAGRRDQVGTFSVLADSPDSVPRIARAIDQLFENSPAPTKTESEQAFALSFVSFLGNVKMFLFSICGAVTFTILLVTANTMAMSVRERIREVGILKTLGYTPGAILGLILGESAVISLAGGVLGIMLAMGMTAAIRNGPGFFSQLKTLSMSPAVGAVSLLTALFIGVISSFLPAWSAAKTSILEAVRSTG